MERFSLKEYIRNPKRRIVTECGNDARIICTDSKMKMYSIDFPVVALVKYEGNETAWSYTADGRNSFSEFDLYFAENSQKDNK